MAPGKRYEPTTRFDFTRTDRQSMLVEQSCIAAAIEQALSSRSGARVEATDRPTFDIHVEIGPVPVATFAADIRFEFGYWVVDFDDGQTLVGFQDSLDLVHAVAGKLTPRLRRLRE